MSEKQGAGISFFAKYLSIWVALCIVAGVAIGYLWPGVPAFLGRFEYAQVSIPIAVLIWLMIYPMMLKVDFASIRNAGNKPKGLIITLVVNWLIKPFSMYLIAALFLKVVFRAFIPANLATEYLAGAVAISLFGLSSGAALATVVGVPVEVLVMLSLVNIARRTRGWFPAASVQAEPAAVRVRGEE